MWGGKLLLSNLNITNKSEEDTTKIEIVKPSETLEEKTLQEVQSFLAANSASSTKTFSFRSSMEPNKLVKLIRAFPNSRFHIVSYQSNSTLQDALKNSELSPDRVSFETVDAFTSDTAFDLIVTQ